LSFQLLVLSPSGSKTPSCPPSCSLRLETVAQVSRQSIQSSIHVTCNFFLLALILHCTQLQHRSGPASSSSPKDWLKKHHHSAWATQKPSSKQQLTQKTLASALQLSSAKAVIAIPTHACFASNPSLKPTREGKLALAQFRTDLCTSEAPTGPHTPVCIPGWGSQSSPSWNTNR